MTKEAEDAWVELLLSGPELRDHRLPRLHARLLQQRGPARRRTASSSSATPPGAMAYFQYLDAWRSKGDFEGLEFR